MRRHILLSVFALVCMSLQARPSPEWFRRGIVYQIQPRAFTPEGTLAAATARLAAVRETGADIVYLCPVFVMDTTSAPESLSPRHHKSGFARTCVTNPYRIADYFHVDPEFGSDADLKRFVEEAHRLGMRVLLDLVYAHCGPASVMLRTHPGCFRYENGKIWETEWHFPRLDFSRPATRAYCLTNMAWLLCEFGVDGFRCDVAMAVPLDFWEEARDFLEPLRPDLVMVAEADGPRLLEKAFDAHYNWSVVRVLRAVLYDRLGKYPPEGVLALRHAIEKQRAACPPGAVLWNYVENHDYANDSYGDRVEAVYGPKHEELALATVFALEGQPLLYNGQEVCDTVRHSIFGHGPYYIDWSRSQSPDGRRRTELLGAWARMRRTFPALIHGTTQWLDNDCPAAVLSFLRTLRGTESSGLPHGEDVFFAGNFSGRAVKVRLQDGRRLKLGPWEYVFEPIKPNQYAR